MSGRTAVWEIATKAAEAITQNVRTGKSTDDKEYHFQRWVGGRIREAGYSVADPGRNTYPDFTISSRGESYEVKGITVNSREGDFDCNSAMVKGTHAGLPVLYVFGRYETGDDPRVIDAVIVHGDFMNADDVPTAKNRSLRALGSYGDVLLRDRKMYVAYTPYGLLDGVRGHTTVIVPKGWPQPSTGFSFAGTLSRKEGPRTLIGYEADLVNDTLQGRFKPNANAGKNHDFEAWRFGADQGMVTLSRD